MAINYAAVLKSEGYTKGLNRFQEVLADAFANVCPNWTDEELLYDPLRARDFCETVRNMTLTPFKDDFILRSLANCRKNGPRVTPRKRKAKRKV